MSYLWLLFQSGWPSWACDTVSSDRRRQPLVLGDGLSVKEISTAPSTRKSRENQRKAPPRISLKQSPSPQLQSLCGKWSSNLSEDEINGTVCFLVKLPCETGLRTIGKDNEICFGSWFLLFSLNRWKTTQALLRSYFKGNRNFQT